MQLFVRGVAGASHVLEIQGKETIGELVQLVCQRDGMSDVDDVVLYHAGSPLLSGSNVSECGLGELSTLELEARLLGGKVHGSLARAGKVKGQTPKVEKGEKKKKKTGRAKRRMQYNRRFVNVVAQFGRKKGPNSRTP
jgi:small subunit ribosomal protein S30e